MRYDKTSAELFITSLESNNKQPCGGVLLLLVVLFLFVPYSAMSGDPVLSDKIEGVEVRVVPQPAVRLLDGPSRFSDGGFGVYYAGDSLNTAIEETKFHRERFLGSTKEDPGEIGMRVYIRKVAKPLHDIRVGYDKLHDPDTWSIVGRM